MAIEVYTKERAEREAYNKNQDEPAGTAKVWYTQREDSGHYGVYWKWRKG